MVAFLIFCSTKRFRLVPLSLGRNLSADASGVHPAQGQYE